MLYLSDIVMCILASLIGCILFADKIMPFSVETYLKIVIIMTFMLVINYSQYGLYDDKRNIFNENDFMAIIYSISLVFLITFAVIFLFDALNLMNVIFILFSYLLIISFTVIGRMILSTILAYSRKKGYDLKRVVIFGEDSLELANKIKENKSIGYRVVGRTDSIEELKSLVKNTDIVFMLRNRINTQMMEIILNNDTITWKIIPSLFNIAMENINIDEFRDCPNILINPSVNSRLYDKIKRLEDFIGASLSLLILSPLFLIIALIIKMTTPGPVFFRHKRVGKNLREFNLFKFRSMIINAEERKKEFMDKNEVKGIFKIRNDPRITPFGKFIRKTCIDELPQIINILKGDMSFVGPRPHLRSELPNFSGWKMQRFRAKPGLTGLWQVSGRHELNFDKAILLDIYYIKHKSFILDLQIILKTIPSIIFSTGKW